MFTGIITDIGTIERIEQRGDLRVRVATAYDTATIDLGASISCSGVCLTVIDKSGPGAPRWVTVDVAGETVACTAAAQWGEGRTLKLQRAMRLGDELGGHIVTGHVDGVATVLGVCPEGDSKRSGFTLPTVLAPFVAAKGSVTVDGVSLTVNDVRDADGETHFSVNVIPHTQAVTTLGTLAAGQTVNIEIDVLARYLQRMQSLARK